jgi:hypothetical protein
MLNRASIGFLFLGLAGCHATDEKASASRRTLPEGFQVPVLTQVAAGHLLVSAKKPVKMIVQVWPPFVGRYPFAPRLAFETPDSLGEKDFIQGNYLRRLEATQAVSSDGLEVVADYSRTLVDAKRGDNVAQQTFPVYVANTTLRTKYVYGESSRLYAIQEARDRSGKWRPIERVGPAWCGGNEFALALQPQHLVMFLVNKYEGTFATELRVRVQIGECRYVSQPYAGQIEEEQFAVSPADYRLLERYPAAIHSWYLGAVPVAMDSIKMRHARAADVSSSN